MERIQRTVGELLAESTWSELPPTATVAAAVAAMNRDSSESVLVIDGDHLVGVFTCRDFLYRVAADGKRADQLTLAEVMTRDPVSLRRVDCVTYAINLMTSRNIRNVPILDDDGRPVALLRVCDVVAHLADVFEEIAELPPGPVTDDVWLDLGGG